MIPPVVTIVDGMKEKKRIKTRIGMGFAVKENVGEMEEDTREGRIRRMRKEVM